MKKKIIAVMKQVKMMRDDMWISKAKFPAVFREVFERTFMPSVIIVFENVYDLYNAISLPPNKVPFSATDGYALKHNVSA